MTTTSTNAIIAATTRGKIAVRRKRVREVAAEINIPPATFYRRLSGKSDWTAEEIVALATYFGAPITDFYGGHVGTDRP